MIAGASVSPHNRSRARYPFSWEGEVARPGVSISTLLLPKLGCPNMETSSVQVDATKSGVKVRHAQNPTKVGETTGEVRFRAGRDVATIRLANGELTYIPVDQLE